MALVVFSVVVCLLATLVSLLFRSAMDLSGVATRLVFVRRLRRDLRLDGLGAAHPGGHRQPASGEGREVGLTAREFEFLADSGCLLMRVPGGSVQGCPPVG